MIELCANIYDDDDDDDENDDSNYYYYYYYLGRVTWNQINTWKKTNFNIK